MASITHANVMQHLNLAAGVESDLRSDMLGRIGLGLQWVAPPGSDKTALPKPARKSRKSPP
jgi:hypothetical protein